MISTATIKAALRTWLVDATSATVIFADQAGPRPATDYLTLKIIGIRPIGVDTHYGDIDDITTEQTMVGDRVLSVSVNAIGPNAWDKARSSANAIDKVTAIDKLRTAGLHPLKALPFDDLTTLLETEWEPRVHFDAEFSFAAQYVDVVGLIETVEITEKYTNGKTYEDTFQVG